MTDGKAIKLLTKLINKISDLKQRNYSDNKEYWLWHDEVLDTLDTLFGRNSVEYLRFATVIRSYNPSDSETEKQQKYIRELETDETNLKSIIRRQEIKDTLKYQKVLQWFTSYIILKPWQWIKSHARLTTFLASLTLIIALLGTNWDIVEDNFNKIVEFLRSAF